MFHSRRLHLCCFTKGVDLQPGKRRP
uniref:Uncharacterized protein n=1 Tax=Anguilla anguilla TaxID=7936 RepID=A0A0E9Q7W9_ANGAN